MSTLGTLAIGAWWMWGTAYVAGLCGQLWWLTRGGEVADRFWRACARVHQELWILVPPGMLTGAVMVWHDGVWWMLPFQAWGALSWWQARDWPDENRWKRRGRKAREVIARRGARLVVVPQ